MAEISYNGIAMQTEDITHTKGTDALPTWVHGLGPGTAVQQLRLQIVSADDGTVWVDKNLDDHPLDIDLTVDNEVTIHIHDTDTSDLPSGDYKYGLQVIDNNDIDYRPWSGKWDFRDGVVNEGETSPSATWETRQDWEDAIALAESKIENAASINAIGIITVDAALGAAAVTIHDTDFLTASDSISIQLDDGNYDSCTVASIVGNVVNLSAFTLSAAASIGNAVLKV